MEDQSSFFAYAHEQNTKKEKAIIPKGKNHQ